MIELYSAEICPFAQRTRALLTHLEIPFKIHEIDLDLRDPDFLALTPTGKVPLLVDGQHRLYESAVINEYLADRHGYAGAYADDSYLRARERLAMTRWDGAIAPAFYGSMHDATTFDRTARAFVAAELDELLKTVLATGQRQGSLLAFHCAPFWARMSWVRQACSVVTELIDERIMLRKWLDGALAQPAVQATLPDKAATLRRYRERFRGFRAAEV